MKLTRAHYRDRRTGERRELTKWYVRLVIGGREDRIPAFTDRRASLELGHKLERLAGLRAAGEHPDAALATWLAGLPGKLRTRLAKAGLLDRAAVASSKPLADHLADYRRALGDSGATRKHVQTTAYRVGLLLDGIGARFLADVTAAKVVHYLGERRKLARSQGGLSTKSANHYLGCAKAFLGWLVSERRATENPLAHLSAMNAAADRRHVRRALEPDELRRLLAAARSGPVRSRMSGEARHWLYKLAAETGLRSNELRHLTAGCFTLHGPEPSVSVEAATAKNRKAAVLPLRPDTADGLRGFLAGKAPAAPVFKLPRPETVVAMMRADLEAAGVPYRDDSGRVADFHSLRATFASMLLRAGVDVRTAKELMRHSSIVLTADVYACTFRGALGDAVKRLPDLTDPEPQTTRMTGTYATTSMPVSMPVFGARSGYSVPSGSLGAVGHDDAQTAAGIEPTRTAAPGAEPSATVLSLTPTGIEPVLPA